MSNFLSKIAVKKAVDRKAKLDLSCEHITTTDFFRYRAVYNRELVPGQSITINMSTFTRLAPLSTPMYGSAAFINRAFFVPYRTIMEGWNEFITDTNYGDQLITHVPTISDYTIAQWFIQNSTVTTSATYDFNTQYSGTTTKYKFNDNARQAYNILRGLGYNPNLGCNESHYMDTVNSALPLLAFYKVFIDWYRNKSYADLTSLEVFKGVDKVLTASDLGLILQNITNAQYNKDYFTSAWDSPVGPNNNGTMNSPIVIEDVSRAGITTVSKDRVVSQSDGTAAGSNTPVLQRADGTTFISNGASQYILNALQKTTDYLKRHQLAGGLAMDRMMARFGVKPSDAALNRSVYLGSDKVPLQISDVMSNADTTTGVVGDYAGKGIGYGSGQFKYETSEYGMILIISVLGTRVGYVQGRDRNLQHINKLDFFTPEFDGLGVQAIRKDEIWAGALRTPAFTSYNPSDVFGYTSRYAEYKCAQDRMSGDFVVPSLASGTNEWHLFRLFTKEAGLNPATGAGLKHDLAFTTGETSQYDRIFANQNSDADHFITQYHFNVESYAPMNKMFDDYEWEDEQHKQSVDIDVNGTQLN